MSDENAVNDSFFDVPGEPGDALKPTAPAGAVDATDPIVGSVLDGRYRLERLLGEGGMGRVYVATQLSVGREVAVKLLRGEALSNRDVKARFLREAKVISGFSHPNIVRLIDYGEDAQRGHPYLVMELVPGISLADLTRRGRLDFALALDIAYQVCGALIQAHSAGIIHRDLKPENLQLLPVLGDSFQAKVLDFGIAFPRESDSRITSTGMICGTAYYIAPEQARAETVDGRADLYSLGIMLFEMLSGHLPFRANSDFQIMLMHVQQPPPALAEYLPAAEVPDAVIALVDELLAKNPAERPATARAVRERIEAIRRDYRISPIQVDFDAGMDPGAVFSPWIRPPAAPAPDLALATTADSGRGAPGSKNPSPAFVSSGPLSPRDQAGAQAPDKRASGMSSTMLALLLGLGVATVAAAILAGYLLGQGREGDNKPAAAPRTASAPASTSSPVPPPEKPAQDRPAINKAAKKAARAGATAVAGEARELAAARMAAEVAAAKKAKADKKRAAKKAAARRASPRHNRQQPAPPPAPPQPPRPAAPPYGKPVSAEVYAKYKKEVTAAADRCARAIQERQEQVARHQKLVDQQRYDEAKVYRDKFLSDSTAYSQKIQAAAYSYSDAIQRAARAGIIGAQLQPLTDLWQARCQ